MSLTCRPAPPDHGVIIYRWVGPGQMTRIPVLAENVTHRIRRTALLVAGAAVETCEHVLAAVVGAGIHNIELHVDASEMPMMDGSALPMTKALKTCGTLEQDAWIAPWPIDRTIRVGGEERWVEARPGDGRNLVVSYALDYGAVAPMPPQSVRYHVSNRSFETELAPARTFVLEMELRALKAVNLCRHLNPPELLVVGATGPIDDRYRFEDEPARHKILDILGDLALVGKPVLGEVAGFRSGHAQNQELARHLRAAMLGSASA